MSSYLLAPRFEDEAPANANGRESLMEYVLSVVNAELGRAGKNSASPAHPRHPPRGNIERQ
jgi:hypothetical protein